MKKKVKKYAGGGLSGIASEATSLMGAADTAANAINSIKGGSGGSQKLGLLNMQPKSYDPTTTFPGPTKMPGEIFTMDTMSPTSKGFSNQISSLGGMLRGTPTFKKGGKVSSASKRADGIAIRGKTRA
jgi:hypothetical protein